MEFLEVSPTRDDIVKLIEELNQETGQLYSPECTFQDSPELLERSSSFMGAILINGKPVAIGAVKFFDSYSEIKRMYVRESHRGIGLASKILSSLELVSLKRGKRICFLETGIYQGAAIALYQKSGFVRTGPFGSYRESKFNIYFKKDLSQFDQ